MSWLALEGLGTVKGGPLESIRGQAYDGVQFIQLLDIALARETRSLGLAVCGSGCVNQPDDACSLAVEARDNGLKFLSIHLGWGLKEDADCFCLIDSVLNASIKFGIPLYPETHRATILHDMWRTIQFIYRYPELRFTGDFSHWYTGLEMVYGDFDRKLAFIQPVPERTRFLHGRSSSLGCMQVDIHQGTSAEQRLGILQRRERPTSSFLVSFRHRRAADSYPPRKVRNDCSIGQQKIGGRPY